MGGAQLAEEITLGGAAAMARLASDPASQASAFIPALRAQASANEAAGRIDAATIETLAEFGFFHMLKPRKIGGAQRSLSVAAQVVQTLARGDASVAWVTAVMSGNSFALPIAFGQAALDDVYRDPAARLASVVNCQKFDAERVDGGVRIREATWGFNSGVYHAHWDTLLAPLVDEASGKTSPAMMLVPVSELETLDDWRVNGLCATGSTSVRARNLFIPSHRISTKIFGPLPAPNPFDDDALYRIPPGMVGSYLLVASVVGAARGLLDQFLEGLPGRRILYTKYADQQLAPVTHLQLGEAGAKIAAAEMLLGASISEIENAAESRASLDLEARGRLRATMALIARLACEGADLVAAGAGGSFIVQTNPLNRAWRNVRAGAQHSVLTATTAFEALGRIHCGLDPENPTI